MQDESVKVTAAAVHHPPVVPAFAYLFDAVDARSYWGDTAPCDALVKLAQGADILVYLALYVPAVDRLVARVPNATTLKQSIIAHQTSAEDAGRVAQAAAVEPLSSRPSRRRRTRRSPNRCGSTPPTPASAAP